MKIYDKIDLIVGKKETTQKWTKTEDKKKDDKLNWK